MKVKTYSILVRAIEEGINYGYARAHKHTGNPTEDQLKIAIGDAVINEICEVFDFFDTPETTQIGGAVICLQESKTVL
jgi:hypothetical protein